MELNCVILIPAHNPPASLPAYLQQLQKKGFSNIILVDDGSRPEKQNIFAQARQLGCLVPSHEKNRGKGSALKTGFSCYLEHFQGNTDGIVTVNSDGQDAFEDIMAIARALHDEKNNSQCALVLGCRDFDSPNLPRKNRIGNKISRVVYKVLLNMELQDTLCGLRGIPDALIEACMSIPYRKYAYETGMLIEFEHQGFVEVPVHTPAPCPQAEKHYRPVIDTFFIYVVIFKKFLLFTLTSVSVSILDIFLFWLFNTFCLNHVAYSIIWSTIIARIISATINYIINKTVVFQNSDDPKRTASLFIILSICQCLLSALLVHTLEIFSAAEPVLLKVIVDVGLFFVNYKVQHMFIFKK